MNHKLHRELQLMRPVVRTFSQLHLPNETTFNYNTIIKSHLSNPNPSPQTALQLFVKMKRNGISCDNYTYPIVLKACRMIHGLWEGRQIHSEVLKLGFFDSDVFVRNGLIGIYCKCGQMSCSRALFDFFNGKNLVSWNLMVSGYVECGDMVEAQKVFDEMPERDVASWSIMIDGYGKKLGDIARARSLFEKMPKRDLVSWNTMIDTYTKAGNMVLARELFDTMEHKSLISWSIIINGYLNHQDPMEALKLFNLMLSHGVKPDKFCVVGAISSCAQLGTLNQGRWIHMYIKKNKIALDIVVNTALMDMYMKCGSTDEARAIFSSMPEKNVVSWNVMISGLGMNGFADEALTLFSQMEEERVQIDDLVYVSVLSACSHGGFVTKGVEIFRRIRHPKVEHYGCLVDVLVRGGKLDEAVRFIASMPMGPNKDLWGAVLSGCRGRKDVGLGELVLSRVKEGGGDECGVYVVMSNIYAENEMWDEVVKVREVMVEEGGVKESGKSVMEVGDGRVVEFVCGGNGGNEGVGDVVWSLSKMVDLE